MLTIATSSASPAPRCKLLTLFTEAGIWSASERCLEERERDDGSLIHRDSESWNSGFGNNMIRPWMVL